MSNKKSVEIDGTHYDSLKDVSRAFDIDYGVVLDRYSKGLRGKQLVKKLDHVSAIKESTGYSVTINGVKYKSLGDLADAYNLPRTLVRNRWARGKKKEELVEPKKVLTKKQEADTVET